MEPKNAEENQLLLDLSIDGTCYNQLSNGMPLYPTASNPQTAKALGAFYTDVEIAEFLARWAIRNKTDKAIDPSFGGGVFLRAAAKRFNAIGGDPGCQIYGVEIDKSVHSRIVSMLRDEFGVADGNLIRSDFFDVERESLPEFDAVIGNPPFIRYQRFAGPQRQAALARAMDIGVGLSQLSSSWAPFLVLSAALLRDGGRLAMVIPMELTYATYARPVIGYLQKSFRRVSILTFRKRLFPDISEDAVLLLCEHKGSGCEGAFHYDLANSGTLRSFEESEGSPLPQSLLRENSLRLSLQFVGARTRRLYGALRAETDLQLGRHCNIGIGYVTGSNEFFHLSKRSLAHWKIPRKFLRPAVLNGRAFSGTVFSIDDLACAMESENAGFLLYLCERTDDPEVNAYLRHGVRRGVPSSYKCRSRDPWFSVPHVYEPHCFLTYMSGTAPRLIANSAGAVAPNNLHVLRFRTPGISSEVLSAAWLTSLSQLSAEIEGHALGGGMLKIEPREAARLVVPVARLRQRVGAGKLASLEKLVRQGDLAESQALADRIFIKEGLGLSEAACEGFRDAVASLRQRRMSAFQ
ncbi:MAG: N-6 DNA methylase [Elusimicrobia bacterium]|nr:N-6 DNA methylase [Elusimicrobiota bacterium]